MRKREGGRNWQLARGEASWGSRGTRDEGRGLRDTRGAAERLGEGDDFAGEEVGVVCQDIEFWLSEVRLDRSVCCNAYKISSFKSGFTLGTIARAASNLARSPLDARSSNILA